MGRGCGWNGPGKWEIKVGSDGVEDGHEVVAQRNCFLGCRIGRDL